MRFKKGSKVEVLCQREAPSRSWRSAEIVSGDGRKYYVKYSDCSLNDGKSVERVPRMVLRPSPPLLECHGGWVAGDILEVFDNVSWKMAEVSKVLDGNYFTVRLLGDGYSRHVRAHASQLRLRQSWKDDRWIVVGQDSGRVIDGRISMQAKEGDFTQSTIHPCKDFKHCAGNDNFLPTNNGFCKSNFQCSSRDLKRRSDPNLGPSVGGFKKRSAVNRAPGEGDPARVSFLCLEKVDAVVSPQYMLGEKYMHDSLVNRTTGYSKGETGRAESISSSVGSCSTSGRGYRSHNHPISGLSKKVGSYVDDAEYSSCSQQKSSLSKVKSAEEIHLLELRSYRTTITALYALGPISWEQEAWLTNLRLKFNISNDEHLTEIKHLVSAETNASSR